MPTSDLLTVKAFARRLGRHEDTVYRMVKRGELDVVRLGGRILIPESEVARLVGRPRPAPAPLDPEVEALVQLWFQTCETRDPITVLGWLALRTLAFRVRHPQLAADERTRAYRGVAANPATG